MKTVYVGMSGGVDSSVAAALLVRQGYRVVGVYMKNWTRDVAGMACSWQRDLEDARAAAAAVDIPFKVMDFQVEYKEHVVDVMVAEYAAGRTPNPDVLCNQEVKFRVFLAAALADGADFVATGHYARTDGEGRLFAARDAAKDQSYFLYRVTAEALCHTIFPLGELTKPEVRARAREYALPTAAKPDSQGICFVGEVGIKEFLREYGPAAEPGNVVLRRSGGAAGHSEAAGHDEVIGQHDGALYYTIGQRHGLGIGGGRPYYVIGKDMEANEVYVTDDAADLELETADFDLRDVHWIGRAPESGREYGIRARYRAGLISGQVKVVSAAGEPGETSSDSAGAAEDKVRGSTSSPVVCHVHLAHSERAVSPGQSAVIYDGDEVLGGGIIV